MPLLLIATGIVVRNTLVTYDRENERIGFWKTNCSELWDRLNLSPSPPPPPLPSGLDNTNSSANLTPALAPSLPLEHAPGTKKLFSYLFVTISMPFSHAFIQFCSGTGFISIILPEGGSLRATVMLSPSGLYVMGSRSGSSHYCLH